MFSFFKKSKKENLHSGEPDSPYSFSDDQKKAILVSLYEIANSDQEFHQKESEYHMKISDFLDYSIRKGKLKRLLSKEKDHLYQLLSEFSESQKDWYVFNVVGMVYADGKIIKEEFEHVQKFLLSIGFSKDMINRNLEESSKSMDKMV